MGGLLRGALCLHERGRGVPGQLGRGPRRRDGGGALQEKGSLDPRSVPTAYRYALFAADGALLAADMDGAMLEHARELAADDAAATETEVTGSAGATYASFELADGTVCVLGSDYLPQFTSPSLRDALPNPQNIMLAAGALGSLAAVALAARRAGRAISRKMAPLAAAAERVSQQDLDFSVEPGGVREVDEVLSAMDRMRSSLKESLEARWDVERRQRDQVAALAHDLKTRSPWCARMPSSSPRKPARLHPAARFPTRRSLAILRTPRRT